MDFVEVDTVPDTNRQSDADFNVRPEFLYAGIKDLVIRGGAFYAFWNGERWSTNIDDLIVEIDKSTRKTWTDVSSKDPEKKYVAKYIRRDGSGLRTKLDRYMKQSPNSDAKFNSHILFSDDTLTREDYATAQLSYTPKEGASPNFDELLGTLYEEKELEKILWFMGAALTNSMKGIQKFMYLYGGKGTGKGTVIDIFKLLFEGYYAEISLATLTGGSEFATAQVQEVPVLVDSDSDISRIKQDTNLLKLTAHEPLLVNKKFQSQYEVEFDGLLITASNQRYAVRNVDAGINRRAVVVEPSNNRIPYSDYRRLMAQIKYELPAIAYKAIKVFEEGGPAKYEASVNLDMMTASDPIFEFVHDNYKLFGDPTSLKRVSEMFKVYLDDLGWETRGYKRRIKNELQRYYKEFREQARIDGVLTHFVYSGFKKELVVPDGEEDTELPEIALNGSESAFDAFAADYPAQYANDAGTPEKAWDKVATTLKDLDTTKLHYVRVPLNHIVIDLDLRDENGEKDLKKNLQKATEYPPTYAELSKSGNGVHLHYLYQGNPEAIDPNQGQNIEAKVYSGKSSLRRKLTKFNDAPVASLGEGTLRIKKEEPTVYDNTTKEMIWTEKKMRTAIDKNLRKEYHPATKPSIDFIKKIFEDAEKAGVEYDLMDYRQPLLVFALKSTNHKKYCLDVVHHLNYKTTKNEDEQLAETPRKSQFYDKKDLYFYDIEVYPNLLIVCWKQYGKKGTTWFNPTPAQIEALCNHPLVGFNNRRYDNHILYNRMLGASEADLFVQSQKIITSPVRSAGMFGNAYDLSYADIYDYSSKKQSLKKWEVEMGVLHDEFELPWDQPLDKESWGRAAEYCMHDCEATNKLFDYTYADYEARRILSELTGLPVNATTQMQAASFLFGDDPHPEEQFVYTDLSTLFPGYEFKLGKSSYMGDDPSEGGYVYSEPGVYENVAEIDVESMHPTSIINLNYFGPYTQRFADLKQARLYVKHKNFEEAGKMFGGVLKPYLNNDNYKALAYALKIIINIVYGLTSAKFPNKFKQPQNLDNIVAKRGALFMITLKHAIQDKGWQVVHIKTDSIKLNDITEEKLKFVQDFGHKYGYEFAVEHIFDRFALLNKAVNIGHVEDNPKWGDEANQWEAIGAQFADPYVFKKLFSQVAVTKNDFAVTKQSKFPIHIGEQFVGKVAQVYASTTGGEMTITNGAGNQAYIQGTKGFTWNLFSEYKGKEDVDMEYYEGLVHKAIKDINKVGPACKLFDVMPEEYESLILPSN